jgi:hypothetical protein
LKNAKFDGGELVCCWDGGIAAGNTLNNVSGYLQGIWLAATTIFLGNLKVDNAFFYDSSIKINQNGNLDINNICGTNMGSYTLTVNCESSSFFRANSRQEGTNIVKGTNPQNIWVPWE